MAAKAIGGSFSGKLTGDEINDIGNGGDELPLVLKRVDKIPDLVRPQVPKKPYPYLKHEVTFRNEAAGVTLAGTLTLPKVDQPSAAVLLISGSSGEQDRDESLLGHQPFLVLADDLTRRGIAVLRVDDRGVGGSTGDLANSTTDDLAGDVLAGVELLRKHAPRSTRDGSALSGIAKGD